MTTLGIPKKSIATFFPLISLSGVPGAGGTGRQAAAGSAPGLAGKQPAQSGAEILGGRLDRSEARGQGQEGQVGPGQG